MIAKIIKIGNSHGIRIPKTILEQTGLENEVRIEIIDKQIILTPLNTPRQGWSEAFQQMARNGDDELLINEPGITEWDEKEWEW